MDSHAMIEPLLRELGGRVDEVAGLVTLRIRAEVTGYAALPVAEHTHVTSRRRSAPSSMACAPARLLGHQTSRWHARSDDAGRRPASRCRT
jgi:hypothetical protein